MAKSIDFEDFLITYEIVYGNNLNKNLLSSEQAIYKFADDGEHFFRNFEKKLTSKSNAVLKYRIDNNISLKRLKKIRTTIAYYRDAIISTDTNESLLEQEVKNAFYRIQNKIISRFDAVGLNIITGQLIRAVRRGPTVAAAKTKGIQAGIAQISKLQSGTPPYILHQKDGQQYYTPTTFKKSYSYTTGDGEEISVEGYWAFQEFGAKGSKKFPPIKAGRFLLNASRTIHGTDREDLQGITRYVRQLTDEFIAEMRDI